MGVRVDSSAASHRPTTFLWHSSASQGQPASCVAARAFVESIITWTDGLSANTSRANSSTAVWASTTSRFASPSPWTTVLRWHRMFSRILALSFFSALPAPHMSRMERTLPMVETFMLDATRPPQLVLLEESKVACRMIISVESSPGLESRCISSFRLHTSSIVVANLTVAMLRSSGSSLLSRGPIRYSLSIPPSSPVGGSPAPDRAHNLRFPMPGQAGRCI